MIRPYFLKRICVAGIILLLSYAPFPVLCLETMALACTLPCCNEQFPDLYYTGANNYSPAVEEIQAALKLCGHFEGACNGIYNETTVAAVKSFQSEQGLAVDGVVRYHVWLKLAAKIEQHAEANKNTPPPAGLVEVVIDTFRRKLIVFNDYKPYAQFPIAIGKAETPSPIGNWKVINKAINWGTGFGTRWIGLNVPWGVYGIHGTNKPWSIGSMASHGCFRMWNRDVEKIYTWIKHGTTVTVIGNPFGYMAGGIQTLNVGDSSAAVKHVQQRLKNRGFYKGTPDGLFGPATEKAVKLLQKRYNLETSGQVGIKEYQALGVW